MNLNLYNLFEKLFRIYRASDLFCITFKYMRSFKNILLKFNKVFKIWGKEKVIPLFFINSFFLFPHILYYRMFLKIYVVLHRN